MYPKNRHKEYVADVKKWLIFVAVFSILSLVLSNNALAYSIETKSIASSHMDKSFPATIVLPSAYNNPAQRFPVLYLLHGHGGDHTDWLNKTVVATLADHYSMIVVMPNGDKNKWYMDSPINSNYRYRSYIAQDVVQYVDQHYRTITTPAGRALAGLSMGGYGALHIALQHPDIFGAMASTSGGVDPRPFVGSFDLDSVLGDANTLSENWHNAAIISQIARLKMQSQALYIDCGDNDFFIDANRQLHQALRAKEIPHHYAEWPGEHNWDFWQRSIHHQMIFFSQFFKVESQ
ncbi:alpha/beta hydrolase [Alishewanella tabrizica]|nr:alpha/beta hydrolase family protein [Alishewanella tabrizica]